MKRVVFDISLFLFIFLLPWWVTLIWAIVGLFVFANFYEFLASSVIIYIMTATKASSFIHSSILVYFAIIIFYMIVQFVRRHIILYKNEIPYKS